MLDDEEAILELVETIVAALDTQSDARQVGFKLVSERLQSQRTTEYMNSAKAEYHRKQTVYTWLHSFQSFHYPFIPEFPLPFQRYPVITDPYWLPVVIRPSWEALDSDQERH